MELVDRIIDIQEKNNYTDQQMAEAIGCSRPTYQRTRTKKIPAGSIFIKGALRILHHELNNNRVGEVNRKTKETKIHLKLDIDSNGNKYDINTGIKMFDHLLKQVAQHGRFGITLSASKWDNQHHLIEDIAICLGKALGQALGEKRGIIRMGDATVIMDDAIATVAVDISGRGYTKLELDFSQNSAEWQLLDFPPDLIRQFLESFAAEAKLNIYAKVLDGTDDHHKAEVLFKALGRALDKATRIDPRIILELPSTKGLLEG
jgi:imidazoleglycerol-phosphate dehydratase